MRYVRIICLCLVIAVLLGVFTGITPTIKALSASTYTNNPTIQTRLNAIFEAYEPGVDFFTKNGKACSCHATSGFSCIDATDSRCNCVRKVTVNGKQVDLYGSQCIGYARYCQQMLFGCNEKSSASKFTKISGVSSLTAAKAKTWFTENKASLHTGTHIRVYNSGHSICLLSVDYENGIVNFLECNWYNQSTNSGNWCRVNPVRSYSWSKFASTYGSIDYAYVYNNYYTEYPNAAVLSVKYNANGGEIANSNVTGTKYKVTDEAGLNMRSGAGTSYTKVVALSKNTEFVVNTGDTKIANGYTWGKTTVGENTGWVVISDFVTKVSDVRNSTYYINSSMIYQTSTSAECVQKFTQGEYYENGLRDANTFGISRGGYIFIGWTTDLNGGGVIDDKLSFKPEEIIPDIMNGNMTVTVYAVWKKVCENHNYSCEVTVTPTASQTGTLIGTCEHCEEIITVSLPQLNATDYTYAVVKTPTCTITGIARYTWNTTSYGSIYFDIFVNKLSHSWNAATCIDAQICEGCGATNGLPLGHNYVSGSCNRCGAEDPDCWLDYLEDGTILLHSDGYVKSMTIGTEEVLDLNGHILTVENLASFGQIVDTVGDGGLIVSNMAIVDNDWLPIQDNSGCYRFYEYQVSNLGVRENIDCVAFGFALDFVNDKAYSTLLESDDVSVQVTLRWGDSNKTVAFSKMLVQKYAQLQNQYPQLRPYMKLNVTGIDTLSDGTVLTVTPSIAAIGGKINKIGESMQYIA